MTSLEGTKVKLEYLTHDARGILKTLQRDDLNIFWQVRLMELCYNHNVTTVLNVLKNQLKRNPDLPLYHIIKESIPFISTNKRHNNATFTDDAIISLYMIDRSLLVTDYNCRLEALADILDKLSKDDVSIVVSENDRCNMGLLLSKMEEYIGDREKQWKSIRQDAKFTLPEFIQMSQVSKDKIQQLLEDLKGLK